METSRLSLKQWSESDRPREKLMLKGRSVLSDAELIAILLGSGNRHETAVELGKRLLAACEHDLNKLAKMDIGDLTKFKGIGTAKAISVITALELGRRRKAQSSQINDRVSSSAESYALLEPVLADLGHEEFWTLYLSNANRLLARTCISQGGITGTVADVRLIFRKALELKATAIILAHNHPSGNLKPSHADRQLTKKMREAGQIMDIAVLDHLILGQGQYLSFADEGWL